MRLNLLKGSGITILALLFINVLEIKITSGQSLTIWMCACLISADWRYPNEHS